MEIPVLRMARTVVTRWRCVSRERKNRCKHPKRTVGKAAVISEDVTRTETQVGKHTEPAPGKAAMAPYAPVPETDTGGQGENPQADGRSIVKELGKMAP